MKLHYAGKDVFILGSVPPKPKFDTAELYLAVANLMQAYGLTELTACRPS